MGFDDSGYGDAPKRSDAPHERVRANRWLLAYVVLASIGVVALGALFALQISQLNAAATGPEDIRIPVLKQMLEQDPENLDARRQLAFTYQQLGQDKKALREYDRVLEVQADDVASLYNSGVVSFDLDRGSEGESFLLRVLKLEPGHALASRALAEYYAEERDYAKTVAVAVPAADAHPQMADLQYWAGLGLELTGEEAEALTRYQRALELIPDMEDAIEAVERLEAK